MSVDEAILKVTHFNTAAELKADHNRIYKELKALYDELQEINEFLFNSDHEYWFQEYKDSYISFKSKKVMDNNLRLALRFLLNQLVMIKEGR